MHTDSTDEAEPIQWDDENYATAHEHYLAVTKDGSFAHRDLVKAAVEEQGVNSQSELHPLYGRKVIYDGNDAIIFYAIGPRFICRTAKLPVQLTQLDTVTGRIRTRTILDNREPTGAIADLVEGPDGVLTYTTPAEPVVGA